MAELTIEIGFHRPLWTRIVFKFYLLAAKLGVPFDPEKAAHWLVGHWKPYTKEISRKS